jgi:hypothetical protein
MGASSIQALRCYRLILMRDVHDHAERASAHAERATRAACSPCRLPSVTGRQVSCGLACELVPPECPVGGVEQAGAIHGMPRVPSVQSLASWDSSAARCSASSWVLGGRSTSSRMSAKPTSNRRAPKPELGHPSAQVSCGSRWRRGPGGGRRAGVGGGDGLPSGLDLDGAVAAGGLYEFPD